MTPRDGALPDPTCNTACRRAYATLLRAFLTGRCTNDEYEDGRASIMREHGHDDACEDMHAVVWAMYSDLWPAPLGRQLRRSDEVRRFGARAILFLHSNESYESEFTPSVSSLLRPLMALPISLAVVVGIWLAPPLVQACLVLVWLSIAVMTRFGRGMEWRPGLFVHLDQADGFDRWPFHNADRLAAAADRPIWLAG